MENIHDISPSDAQELITAANVQFERHNVSGATYALIKDKFHCTSRGPVEAKSKGLIDMYFVEKIIS